MNVTLSPYTSCGTCASCRNQRPNACQFNQTMGVQRDGALAELISVLMAKIYAAQLSLTELALVEPLSVGFHAVARANVVERECVLIFGCGGVGLGAVAAAAFGKAVTVAVDVDDQKLEIARRAGATHTIHARRYESAPILAELTGGLGSDVVIEAVGVADAFRSAIELVSFTGRVVYIGYAKEPIVYETKYCVQKELDIRRSRNALPEDSQQVIRMLERDRFARRGSGVAEGMGCRPCALHQDHSHARCVSHRSRGTHARPQLSRLLSIFGDSTECITAPRHSATSTES